MKGHRRYGFMVGNFLHDSQIQHEINELGSRSVRDPFN
jgi:hypothetical protein